VLALAAARSQDRKIALTEVCHVKHNAHPMKRATQKHRRTIRGDGASNVASLASRKKEASLGRWGLDQAGQRHV
jgi:hypothetical protein